MNLDASDDALLLGGVSLHFPRAAFDRRRWPRGTPDRRGEPLPSVNPWATLDQAIELYLEGAFDLLAPAWAALSPLYRMVLWTDWRNRQGPAVWRVASGADRAIPPADLDVLVAEAKGALAALIAQHDAFTQQSPTPKEPDHV